MELLGKYSLRDSVKFVVLLKYFTYIFLIWNLNCDMNTFGKTLEMIYGQDESLNISFNRLLAKHENNNDLKYPKLGEKSSDSRMNKKMYYGTEAVPTYRHLKGSELNGIDAYVKGYKNRYNKMKGLAKLDCYCEKKVFDKIDYLHELQEKLGNDKKLYKKIIYRKFGYFLIMIALFPLLGIIIPLLFNEHFQIIKRCFSDCDEQNHFTGSGVDRTHSRGNIQALISKNTWSIITTMNGVISYISIIIFLILIIYILIKVIKYEKIKAGKGKMNRKEYINFCKEVFNSKK